MSFGRGMDPDVGYGDADNWGGPVDGVDILQGMGDVAKKPSARVSKDSYTFGVIAGALVLLWLLGGVAFRKIRL